MSDSRSPLFFANSIDGVSWCIQSGSGTSIRGPPHQVSKRLILEPSPGLIHGVTETTSYGFAIFPEFAGHLVEDWWRYIDKIKQSGIL